MITSLSYQEGANPKETKVATIVGVVPGTTVFRTSEYSSTITGVQLYCIRSRVYVVTPDLIDLLNSKTETKKSRSCRLMWKRCHCMAPLESQ